MKPIEEFLSYLNGLDIKLWLDEVNGASQEEVRLRCNAPKGILNSSLKTQLRERKSEIIEFLKQANLNARDFRADAFLDSTIYPTASPLFDQRSEITPSLYDGVISDSEPTKILLTGATGFLGAFLLYELLQQTKANIYCLMRGVNPELGKQKIHTHLESYGLWQQKFSARIIPLIGDLSQSLLGLTQEQFESIANRIDVIYHNGALVHLFHPYQRLKAVNVLGTQEILRLASQGKVKPVHFISTLSVIQSIGYARNKVIKEQELIDRWEDLYNGYAQSKWVAERLIAIARSRGIPVTIYRPGLITANSQTGVGKTEDVLSQLLSSFIRLGKAPKIDKILWDITPIDYVSKAVIYISKQQSLGKIFHLINPQSILMSKIVEWMRSFGYALEEVSYDEWRTDLIDVAKNSSEHFLNSLLLTFPTSFSEEQLQVLQSKYDCQNAINALENSSISCPSPSAELIHTYLSYLSERGFLAPPKTDRAELTLNVGNK